MKAKVFFKRSIKLTLAWFFDWVVPIKNHQIIFVTRSNVPVAGNLRVMLDAFSQHPQSRVFLYREGGDIPAITRSTLEAQGVEILQGFGIKVLLALLSSESVVLSHSARDAYITRRKKGRRVVNLWHGVALKQIENLIPLRGNWLQNWYRTSLIERNSRIYDAMISSNSVDRLVNALAFGVPLQKVHPVGLPRFAYFQADCAWPQDLQVQKNHLLDLLAGRRLILYAPTFRDNGTNLSHLLPTQALQVMKAFCQKHDLVFGIRPHPYRTHELAHLCDDKHILNLSAKRFAESAVLLQQTHALVVDYSSIWVDFLYLKRSLLAFAPDKEAYVNSDRGFVHDYEHVFPGPVCSEWTELIAELTPRLETGPTAQDLNRQAHTARLLLPCEGVQAQAIITDSGALIDPSFNLGKTNEENHHLRHV